MALTSLERSILDIFETLCGPGVSFYRCHHIMVLKITGPALRKTSALGYRVAAISVFHAAHPFIQHIFAGRSDRLKASGLNLVTDN
jgi:hypothetical protein